jgi:hypothetical protein
MDGDPNGCVIIAKLDANEFESDRLIWSKCVDDVVFAGARFQRPFSLGWLSQDFRGARM